MSVSNPFVTRIHNEHGNFLQNWYMLLDVVDVKQFLDKNLTSFIKRA